MQVIIYFRTHMYMFVELHVNPSGSFSRLPEKKKQKSGRKVSK